MTELDLSRAREPVLKHQPLGVQSIIDNPAFLLADDMGVGKTCQTILAALVLFERGLIDHVLVISPAAVRPVWFDPELGELRKHLWNGVPCKITEYHARSRSWQTYESESLPKRVLHWTITNYEFIRKSERLQPLLERCGDRVMLVLDESSAVKNYRADQTKSCLKLRRACGRVVLLNGTPIANSPLDMYSQGNIMDPAILACQSYFHFRARYAVMGGFQARQVIGWQNLDDMQRRFAPFVLRRLKTECLDLPPKLDPVTITATLTGETWSLYKEMRDELVAWLDQQTVSVAPQAVVKTLRLAQLTSGFLGGLIEEDFGSHQEAAGIDLAEDDGIADDRPAFIPRLVKQPAHEDVTRVPSSLLLEGASNDKVKYLPPREVSREKLTVFLTWLEQRFDEERDFKLLVWCRFRPELARLMENIEKSFPKVNLGSIWGSQKKQERAEALQLLDPRRAPKGPVVVVGTPSTGKMGLNLTAASAVVYMSNDYSLMTRQQSEDRVHRYGQTHAVSYFDIIAVGPAGQKTIDHAIIKALRTKSDIARFTTDAWRRVLLAA